MTTDSPPPHLDGPLGVIETLNRECSCLSLDKDKLARALDSELGEPGLSEMVRLRCPFQFAALPVFVAAPPVLRMAQVMRAVESVVALPAFREEVLAAAPETARLGVGVPLGVFFGYDVHLDQGRIGLIEVNTNAGGAMLNAVLARAQRASCSALEGMVPTLANVAVFEQAIVDMFRHEWRLSGRIRPLASIAIVDGAPPVYSAVDASGRTLKTCAGSGAEDIEHASYVFLLDEGSEVHPIPHALYVALARGEATATALAGQTLRLADWYVRLREGAPDTIANETYSMIRFDTQGRVDRTNSPEFHSHRPHVRTAPEESGWPTSVERARMRELLFGGTGGTDSPSLPSPTGSGAGTPTHRSRGSAGTGEPPCR